MTRTVLFLCPHSAAKSVMAAAYFQQLADQHRLDVVAAFAGTEPDAAISPPVAELLRAEGIDVTGSVPRLITPEELAQAWRVISLGCEVGHLLSPRLMVERWDDVPPPSQNLTTARALILTHVERTRFVNRETEKGMHRNKGAVSRTGLDIKKCSGDPVMPVAPIIHRFNR